MVICRLLARFLIAIGILRCFLKTPSFSIPEKGVF
jgi:hypothetical protein